MRLSITYRTIAATVLLAFVLTATVPYFCSTGWCCMKHKSEAAAKVPSCCAEKAKHETVTKDTGASCCQQRSTSKQDNSRNSGCATGCCKLVATTFVFAPAVTTTILHPVATIAPASALDTGIELSDYIPQPPRVLSA